MGAESQDLPCVAQDRGVHWGQHSLALGTVPPGTQQCFFHASRKFFASSLPPPLRSISEGIQAGVSSAQGHSPGPKWCLAPGNRRRGGEAVVTGLPTKLSPLLSIPAVVPSVVAGGGLTPVNRAALPPAPSSPAHSSLPTSPHHDPEWPGASLHERHDRMRSEGPEPPREAHWVTRCPPPTSCEPWQSFPSREKAARGSTHCEVAVRLRSRRARPPLE